MKSKTYKEKDTLEKRGTKRFRKRVAEEQEAEEQIKYYLDEEEEHNNDNTLPIQEFLR